MEPPSALRSSWRPLAFAAVVTLAAFLAAAPVGWGLSGGASSDTIQDPNFGKNGCTACHGPANAFRAVDNSRITFRILDAEGGFLNGPYVADATYTLSITFDEEVAPDGGATGNRAGFNLRATSGTLTGVAGESQATADGKQATHLDGKRTAWNVTWKAPASGAVSFQLFVNDVDGSGAQDAADNVHQAFFGLSDKDGNVPGSAAKAEEPHFGITLQQYWIGLFGLAGMIFIMVAGFVYLKFVSPHNTDQKDR